MMSRGSIGGARADAAPDGAHSDAGPQVARCTDRAPQPAEQVVHVMAGGRDRAAVLHLPPSYDPTRPTPLVLNFHGFLVTADSQAGFTGMSAHADQAGYMVAYPAGTGLVPSWNAGSCCGEAAQSGVDDVGYVRALVDALEERLCVDSARIYAAGFSNGGMLTLRLACEMADRFAAFAVVSGQLLAPSCDPARPVSIFHVHGTADLVVPYMGPPPIPQMIAAWAVRDGCRATPVEVLRAGDTACVAYQACQDGAEVELCTVDGGGHGWPGGPGPAVGKLTSAISATPMAWELLSRHALP
jgi:polyhydroxybutyrate depolymerase